MEVTVAHGAVEAVWAVAILLPFAFFQIVVWFVFENVGVEMLGGAYYLFAIAPAYPCCDKR